MCLVVDQGAELMQLKLTLSFPLKFLDIADSVDDIDVDEKLQLIPKTTSKTLEALKMYNPMLLTSIVRSSPSTL